MDDIHTLSCYLHIVIYFLYTLFVPPLFSELFAPSQWSTLKKGEYILIVPSASSIHIWIHSYSIMIHIPVVTFCSAQQVGVHLCVHPFTNPVFLQYVPVLLICCTWQQLHLNPLTRLQKKLQYLCVSVLLCHFLKQLF